MSGFIVNGEVRISWNDVDALVREIERLRGEVAKLEARITVLDRLAYRDALVDLPNRRSLLSRLEGLIERVERHGGPAALLFIDVDGLKQINDRFGHQAGDAALTQIAEILVSVFRRSDCVARIGGDEFAVLLEQADELDAWQMALRVVEAAVGCQFCVKGICLPLSVAVGVAVIQRGDTPQAVMERADTEMYRVKTA